MRPCWLLPALCACVDGSGPAPRPYATCVDDVAVDTDAPPLPPLAPELLVRDVDTGRAWYRDVAGFEVISAGAPERSCFATLELEGGQLMLSHVPSVLDHPGDSIELRFVVADVDAAWARFQGDDVVIVRPLADQDYGLRDFVVRDPYGFRVRFATPL